MITRFDPLASLPAAATGALRALRTFAYQVASPFDSAARRLAGRDSLPPLWLRRHVGPVRAFVPAKLAMAATIRRLALVAPGDHVVDVGCGCGAMAEELANMLGADGRYVGFDVHGPCIRWCRKAFASDTRFHFELAEIDTPFSPGRSRRADAYEFPVGSGAAGFVLAKSVFTHLLEPEARRYLGEIRRVLRPGRRALVTAFLFDSSAAVPAFPFPDSGSPIRWRVRTRPHAAVAFARPLFDRMVRDAGLAVDEMLPAFFPGAAPVPTGQDILVLARG